MPSSQPTDPTDPPPELAPCHRNAVIRDAGGWFTATCGCGWVSRTCATGAIARAVWNTHYLSGPGAKPLVTIVQRLGRFGDA